MNLVNEVKKLKSNLIYLDDFKHEDYYSIRCTTREDVDACLIALDNVGCFWDSSYTVLGILEENPVFRNSYESSNFKGIHFFIDSDKGLSWASGEELDSDDHWVDYAAGVTMLIDVGEKIK